MPFSSPFSSKRFSRLCSFMFYRALRKKCMHTASCDSAVDWHQRKDFIVTFHATNRCDFPQNCICGVEVRLRMQQRSQRETPASCRAQPGHANKHGSVLSIESERIISCKEKRLHAKHTRPMSASYKGQAQRIPLFLVAFTL